MNYRFLTILNSIVLAAFGVMFLVMPEFGLTLFDTETYTATLFVARFMGGILIMAGIFLWVAKELDEDRTQRNMTIMLLVSALVGFVLILIGMVGADVIRTNGWILLVIHILFILGYGYLVSGVTITANKKQ